MAEQPGLARPGLKNPPDRASVSASRSMVHRVGLTLAPQAVDAKTHEIPVALALLRPLVLEGRIVTRAALLTQRPLAQQSVAAQGDYVMLGKEDHPQLWADLETVCALSPVAGERRTVANTLDLGHGRIEQRAMQTSHVLLGDSDWPGLAQVGRLERQVIIKKTGEVREVGGGRSHEPDTRAGRRGAFARAGPRPVADRAPLALGPGCDLG